MTRHRLASLSLVVSAIATVFAGCGWSNVFRGRLFLVNSSHGPITEVSLRWVYRQTPQTPWIIGRQAMEDGATWLNDYRRGEMVTCGDMTLSWSDDSGAVHNQIVPFRIVPEFCDEDFTIYIEPDGSLYCSLGVYGTGIRPGRIATLAIGLGILGYVYRARAKKRRSRLKARRSPEIRWL